MLIKLDSFRPPLATPQLRLDVCDLHSFLLMDSWAASRLSHRFHLLITAPAPLKTCLLFFFSSRFIVCLALLPLSCAVTWEEVIRKPGIMVLQPQFTTHNNCRSLWCLNRTSAFTDNKSEVSATTRNRTEVLTAKKEHERYGLLQPASAIKSITNAAKECCNLSYFMVNTSFINYLSDLFNLNALPLSGILIHIPRVKHFNFAHEPLQFVECDFGKQQLPTADARHPSQPPKPQRGGAEPLAKRSSWLPVCQNHPWKKPWI